MKKLVVMLVALLMTVAANAQFEEGKVYCGASLSSLGLSYSGSSELKLGINAQAGYLFADNLMAVGTVADNHVGSSDVSYYVSV